MVIGSWMAINQTEEDHNQDENFPQSQEINLDTEDADEADIGEEIVVNNKSKKISKYSRNLLLGGTGLFTILMASSIFFEVMRVLVFMALIVPMVARKKSNRDDMLTRGRVLGYLEANSGIHFSALRDALALANGVSAYHLNILEINGSIISWRDGNLRRYAVSSLTRDELRKIRNPIAGTRLAILEVLANSGVLGISGPDLGKKLEISRQLLSHHMNELLTSNLVKKTLTSQRSRWIISDDGIESLSNAIEVSRIQAST